MNSFKDLLKSKTSKKQYLERLFNALFRSLICKTEHYIYNNIINCVMNNEVLQILQENSFSNINTISEFETFLQEFNKENEIFPTSKEYILEIEVLLNLDSIIDNNICKATKYSITYALEEEIQYLISCQNEVTLLKKQASNYGFKIEYRDGSWRLFPLSESIMIHTISSKENDLIFMIQSYLSAYDYQSKLEKMVLIAKTIQNKLNSLKNSKKDLLSVFGLDDLSKLDGFTNDVQSTLNKILGSLCNTNNGYFRHDKNDPGGGKPNKLWEKYNESERIRIMDHRIKLYLYILSVVSD